MQAIADELYDSWMSGNVGHVINEITTGGAPRAALLAALITNMMGTEDKTIFFRMLKEHHARSTESVLA